MNTYTFSQWLGAQQHLQREHFGIDYEELDYDGDKMGDQLHLNLTGLITECAELGECFAWKPWATNRGRIDKERVLEEACDVLAFLGNILNLADVKSWELQQAYSKTVDKIADRQRSGTYEQRMK